MLTATDSDELDDEFSIDVAQEAIALTEYSCRLAMDASVHVIQIDECVCGGNPHP